MIPSCPTVVKKGLTQQSTGIGERFLSVDDGHRSMWQHTTPDSVVFFITKSADMDGDR